MKRHGARVKAQGFSLVEVLVAFVVAAIALLGLAATQFKALQFASSSVQYTVASIEASNIVERIWPQLCTFQKNGNVANQTLLLNTEASGLYNYQVPTFDFTRQPYTAGGTVVAPADFVLSISWSDARLADSAQVNRLEFVASFPWLLNGNDEGCK